MGLSTLISDLLAAKEQKKGIKEATGIMKEAGNFYKSEYEKLRRAGEPEEEAARKARMSAISWIESNVGEDQQTEALEGIQRTIAEDPTTEARRLLESDVMREPGTSPLFQVGLRRGTEALARNYSAMGLVSGSGGSTAFGKATGELTEGLLARDIEATRAARFGLEGIQARDREQVWGRRFGLEGLQARDREADWARRFGLSGIGVQTPSGNAALGLYGGTRSDIANLALGKASVEAGKWRSVGQFGESVSNENYLKGIISNVAGNAGSSYISGGGSNGS